MISKIQKQFLQRAVELALKAKQEGNLPIGAVITLDKKIIAEGRNKIWQPHFAGTRHAEIEALHAIPIELWSQSKEMTLYTTLEPCLMCTGAILLHHIGTVIFGAKDTIGGAGCVFGNMPMFLEHELKYTKWIGPALPEVCDELFSRILKLINKRGKQGLII